VFGRRPDKIGFHEKAEAAGDAVNDHVRAISGES
jgi:hypothetical protein